MNQKHGLDVLRMVLMRMRWAAGSSMTKEPETRFGFRSTSWEEEE